MRVILFLIYLSSCDALIFEQSAFSTSCPKIIRVQRGGVHCSGYMKLGIVYYGNMRVNSFCGFFKPHVSCFFGNCQGCLLVDLHFDFATGYDVLSDGKILFVSEDFLQQSIVRFHRGREIDLNSLIRHGLICFDESTISVDTKPLFELEMAFVNGFYRDPHSDISCLALMEVERPLTITLMLNGMSTTLNIPSNGCRVMTPNCELESLLSREVTFIGGTNIPSDDSQSPGRMKRSALSSLTTQEPVVTLLLRFANQTQASTTSSIHP